MFNNNQNFDFFFDAEYILNICRNYLAHVEDKKISAFLFFHISTCYILMTTLDVINVCSNE